MIERTARMDYWGLNFGPGAESMDRCRWAIGFSLDIVGVRVCVYVCLCVVFVGLRAFVDVEVLRIVFVFDVAPSLEPATTLCVA